jgi:hypothetical protein
VLLALPDISQPCRKQPNVEFYLSQAGRNSRMVTMVMMVIHSRRLARANRMVQLLLLVM